jgi:hypothetical protein
MLGKRSEISGETRRARWRRESGALIAAAKPEVFAGPQVRAK